MWKLKTYLGLIIGAILVGCSTSDGPIETGIESEATYTVTFTMNWNSTDFPTDYPSNAHFSPLIGWSHSSASQFFKAETIATEGIELMAETGATATLEEELKAMIADNEGLDFVLGNGLDEGTGEITVELKVNAANPSISLVSMVAPSPDWYVAIVNENLYNGSNFADSRTITAAVYDSGTDSGSTFTSGNANTDPKGKISLFVNSPLGDGEKLLADFATVTFVKKK